MIRIGFYGNCIDIKDELKDIHDENIIISGYFFNENFQDETISIKKYDSFNELLENSDIIEFLSSSNDIYKHISKTIKNSKNIIFKPDLLKAKELKKIVMLTEEAETKFYIKKNERISKLLLENLNNVDNINCLNIKYFNHNIYKKNKLFLMLYDVLSTVIGKNNLKINKINSYKFSTYTTNDSLYISIITNKANIINLTIISYFYEDILDIEIYETANIYNLKLINKENIGELIKKDLTDINKIIEELTNNKKRFDPEKEVYPLILTHQIIYN